MGFPAARRSVRRAPGGFLRARSVCRWCAYWIMSRIACLRCWRACFTSEAAHALAPASSASFAFDRFWTSFGPEAPRSDSVVVTRASSATSRQSIEANVAATGSLPQSPAGIGVGVVGTWVVVVELDVVVVVGEVVVVVVVVVLVVVDVVVVCVVLVVVDVVVVVVVVVDVVVVWVVVVLVDVVVDVVVV